MKLNTRVFLASIGALWWIVSSMALAADLTREQHRTKVMAMIGAAALGIDRSKLYRRLKQYGVRAVKFLQEEDLDGLQLRARSQDQAAN